MDGAEADDVGAVEESAPDGDADEGHDAGDAADDEDAVEVAQAVVLFKGDDHGGHDGEVAETEDEHPEHELGVPLVARQDLPDGDGAVPGLHGFVAACLAFFAEEFGFVANASAREDGDAHEAQRGGEGEEDAVGVGVVVEDAGEGHADGGGAEDLNAADDADGAHASLVGVVGAPDGGAQGDNA